MTQVVKFAEQSADDVSAFSEILAKIEERRSGFQGNYNDEIVAMPISKIESVVYRWNAELGNFIAVSGTLERFETQAAERISAP